MGTTRKPTDEGSLPRGRVRRPTLRELPCPLCGGSLEPTRGRHGIVFLCHACRAGAATLPILRQVAPNGLVNELWQAALHGGGRPSRRRCPSCGLPFTRLRATDARVEVCVLCFWVWLGPESLGGLDSGARAALPPPLPGGRRRVPLLEAPRALGTLAARAIRDAR